MMDETTATEYTIPGVTEVAPVETAAETLATEPDIQELILIIQATGSDLVHADLFGSFLVCGTLVGIAMLRWFRGT